MFFNSIFIANTKSNCILVKINWNIFFCIKAKNAVIAVAITSIFNEDTEKKKRFIGLKNSCFWYNP